MEALLKAATGLSKEEVLGMVGRAAKPLVQRKLGELGVQPDDVATVSTAIEKLLIAGNTQKLQAVFAAAMPLVQGPVAVSQVEALLKAATGLSKEEVLGMVDRATKPLVQRKLEALDVQPAEAMLQTSIKDFNPRPVLESIDSSMEELTASLDDPMALLKKLAIVSEPAMGKKLAIMYLKPKLEHKLHDHGIQWADVVSALEQIAVEKLQEVTADPEEFLRQVVSISGPAAKKQVLLDLEQNYSVADLRMIQRALAGSKDPLERLFAASRLSIVHKLGSESQQHRQVDVVNNTGSASDDELQDASLEAVVTADPFKVSLHDDQKQELADTISEENSREGAAYVPNGHDLPRWLSSNAHADIPPGPRWIEAASSPSGRAQLLL
jgi:hypothetical protein